MQNSPENQPFVVALTGGIAAGKTAVSDRFAALGISIIDTDLIARDVVTAGSRLLDQISQEFGTAVVTANGELDRAALRKLIFSNPEAQLRLQALMHPVIMQETMRQVREAGSGYCIVVIPLLVETGLDAQANRVLVVDVPESVQLERLAARDGVSMTDARSALSAQASRSERLSAADDVIENKGDLSMLDARVSALHQQYLALATAQG